MYEAQIKQMGARCTLPRKGILEGHIWITQNDIQRGRIKLLILDPVSLVYQNQKAPCLGHPKFS